MIHSRVAIALSFALGVGGLSVRAADTDKAVKPVLTDPSGSESGLDYYSQGGVVVGRVAYFTADQGCSKYWKADGYPFGVAFDVRTFRKLRTYPFKNTYDSCPLLVRTGKGRSLLLAHEYKMRRTVAVDRDTAAVAWISPTNQPGAYFFGYSLYVNPDKTKLVFAAAQNGLHALSAETGEEKWWLQTRSTGGVTPCVDQRRGWVFYQADGRLMKLRASDGAVLKSVDVLRPCTCVSWNTVLAKDGQGYHIATYWFDFRAEDGKTKKMEWNAAIRVYDADLRLVWERTGLPGAKKSTLTYAHGKLVLSGGNHWGSKHTGAEWKYVAAYAIRTGEVVWKCDLSGVDYDCICNVPYAYGSFFAEAWGTTSKMLRINARTGKLDEVLDYGSPVNSCAPFLIAHGKAFSGDLVRDGVVVTELVRNSTAEWPGPFCDPQTNTYALPDDPRAKPVPMRELIPRPN